MFRRTVRILLLLLPFAKMAAAQDPPPVEITNPWITFESNAVVVNGVTAGQPVAWFSVAREATDGGAIIVRREQVSANADASGVARFDLDVPVPPRSVWAAVDLSTGQVALGTPEDFPLILNTFQGDTIQTDSTGKQSQFLFQGGGGTMTEYFVARPSVGAWASTVWDGATLDSDGLSDGKEVALLTGMEAVGSSPTPPDGLVAGDVMIVIDPNELSVAVTQVQASSGGQQQ